MKRKSAAEILASYSSQELMEKLIKELNAVGIEYTLNPEGKASEFIPLSGEEAFFEETDEASFSFDLELFGETGKHSYSYTAPDICKQPNDRERFFLKIDSLQGAVSVDSCSVFAA